MKESRKWFLMALFAAAISAGCVGQNGTATGFERPLYNISPEAFAELPEFPGDFYIIDNKASALSLSYSELAELGESYYKQPEFFPTWESVGITNMQNPPDNRVGIWGFGAYPSEQSLTMKAGDELTTAAFFHTSWMVQTAQGVELVASYNSTIFNVNITPSLFVLGRTYPAFDNNWVQKVSVRLKVKENATAGNYAISLSAKQPPKEYQDRWRKEYQNYVNAPIAAPDRPFLRIGINVQ